MTGHVAPEYPASQVKREVDGLQPALCGCLYQAGWKPCLRQDDPDCGHGWRTRTQVKREINVLFGQQESLQLLAHALINGRIVDWTIQAYSCQRQRRLWVSNCRRQPSAVFLATRLRVVRQQDYPIEPLTPTQRSSYGTDLIGMIAFGCFMIRVANPAKKPPLFFHEYVLPEQVNRCGRSFVHPLMQA